MTGISCQNCSRRKDQHPARYSWNTCLANTTHTFPSTGRTWAGTWPLRNRGRWNPAARHAGGRRQHNSYRGESTPDRPSYWQQKWHNGGCVPTKDRSDCSFEKIALRCQKATLMTTVLQWGDSLASSLEICQLWKQHLGSVCTWTTEFHTPDPTNSRSVNGLVVTWGYLGLSEYW